MRITKIKVNNFKSLVDFEIDLSKFNCIVGLNGSGKSTFLQFMSFLSQLMKGNLTGWLRDREWTIDGLLSFGYEKPELNFEVLFHTNNGEEGYWKGIFNCTRLCCVCEEIKIGSKTFHSYNTDNNGENVYSLHVGSDLQSENPINFKYQGSILSQIISEKLPKEFAAMVKYFANIQSYDPLSPSHLKQRSSANAHGIGREGENLPSFLYDHKDIKKSVETKIKGVENAYPRFFSLEADKTEDQSVALSCFEEINGVRHLVQAPHINDGLIRIIGAFAAMENQASVLLFDEIENGINQELVEFLLNELLEAKQQIVVTTHSALFLNYLDDDLARNSVQYFYKTSEGFTRCRKFFSIPSTAKKLGALGPGEAVDDTNLYRLNEEIEQLDRQSVKVGD